MNVSSTWDWGAITIILINTTTTLQQPRSRGHERQTARLTSRAVNSSPEEEMGLERLWGGGRAAIADAAFS